MIWRRWNHLTWHFSERISGVRWHDCTFDLWITWRLGHWPPCNTKSKYNFRLPQILVVPWCPVCRVGPPRCRLPTTNRKQYKYLQKSEYKWTRCISNPCCSKVNCILLSILWKGWVLGMEKNAKFHLRLQQVTDNMKNFTGTRQGKDSEIQIDCVTKP